MTAQRCQSMKGIYLPARFCWLLGFWATLASHTRKQNQSRNFKSHQLIGRDWGIKFSYCQSPELYFSFPICTSAWGLFILPGWRALQLKIKVIMYHLRLYYLYTQSRFSVNSSGGKTASFHLWLRVSSLQNTLRFLN